MISASRKNDAIISVCQDNENRTIEIQGINQAAEILIGYKNEDIKGKPLKEFISEAAKENLDSYLEFEPGGNDLAAVLGKTRKFQIINKNGLSIPVHLKVFYSLALNSNPRFELLIRDITLHEKIEEMKQQLKESKKNDRLIDKDIGIPDKESLASYLQLIISFITENPGIEASFVIMQIDNFFNVVETRGKETAIRLLKEIAERYNNVCRAEDILGYLGNGKLGFILFDCSEKNTNIVTNRIKNKVTNIPIPINNHENIMIGVTSIAKGLTKNTNVQELVNSFEILSID